MPTAGIEFTETMRGHLSTAVVDDYAKAEARGKLDNTTLDFTVTVSSDDLERLLTDSAHPARIDGSITCSTLSPQPLKVTNGVFNLLTRDPSRVNARLMSYNMTGVAQDGRSFRLDGFKVIHDDRQAEIWPDTTTLFVTVTDLNGAAERVVAKGILHILPADFAHQMTTMKVTNPGTPLDALTGVIRFGKFFAGELFDTYGGVFVRSNELRTDAPPRVKRPLKMSPPEVRFFNTDDGVTLKLTRYNGGSKGPVMLSPGFGTPTLAYSIDTVDTNLPEALFAAGYDVWLFDYRASPDLPSARTQFTLDDVATRDYPAAVAAVRQATGAASVQVMAHCIGSMTFLMAMMAGLTGVRSAISSALTLFPVSPIGNRIRAGLDLGKLLVVGGVETLTTDFDRQRAMDVIMDEILRAFPSKEQCTSAVCRRILGIYGDVYDHNQLNDATHNAMHEMFGVANTRTFNHISLIVRTGHVVDEDGNDTYMPHLDRLAIPITFVHGAKNNLFLPEGSEQTLKAVSAVNDGTLYQRILFPDYAHMDCYIGKNAARDIFPTIVSELDRFN
jgi:choline dehydrogenase-like flavoprotein